MLAALASAALIFEACSGPVPGASQVRMRDANTMSPTRSPFAM
jgi:hypothetical protein